ncbi:MAG: hypothetical protein AABX86_01425 [Nanoarchaeota archaeon]
MQFKHLILPLFLALILILSTFGVILDAAKDESETLTYNDHRYTRTPQGWKTQAQGATVIFHYTPEELASTPNILAPSLDELNTAQKIYAAIHPEQDTAYAFSAFQGGIQPLLQVPVILACWKDGKECEHLPLKSCEDATPEENVILFQAVNASESAITLTDSCLTIATAPETALRWMEALLFRLLALGP